MTDVSQRISRRISRDFSRDAEGVTELLSTMRLMGSVDHERVQAAVVLAARGQLDRVVDAVDLAETDYRDILAASGLANEDWASRLESEFGSADS
ncbi:hypothetical protein [Demequina zhanjiangensis]|uniref:ANTAR domain-containing protein n=1 Tax=Demequina zhanjiangensis TaxID=3051659 RepID=A0ABT8FZF7_9MICO|nr:hypothetical protein [Demequina sp. SYSU T00b26]MDN4471844.1 hypothetical protein [Demequina sp. SYSU T00b26]